ncbi:MAG: MMPL family transporter [Dehalococcoidia bacterium]|nr:MMPL family transporter [Dehalococcoidia bacterium]
MIGSILVRVWEFVRRHLTVVTIIAVLLIVLAAWGATYVQTDTAASTFAGKNTPEYQRTLEVSKYFNVDPLSAVLQADSIDTLITDHNREAYKYAQERISKVDGIFYCTSPEFYIDLALMNPATPKGVPLKDLIVDSATGQVRPAFAGCFPNPQTGMFVIGIRGWPSQAKEKEIIKAVNQILNDAKFEGNINVTLSGMPSFYLGLKNQINKALGRTMAVAMVLMLIILAFLLRLRGSFLWRWLTLGVVLVAILYTFGIAGALNFKTTTVSMAMFPVLLGLGVDYAIQFQNRYEEESQKGRTASDGIRETFLHIGPPIFIAVVACILAFLAMKSSSIPMISNFGAMLSIGIAVSFIVATLLLMSILYRRDRNKKPVTAEEIAMQTPGIVERGVQRLVPFVRKYTVPIILIFVVLAAGGWSVGSKNEITDAATSFANKNTKEMKDLLLMDKLTGGHVPKNIMISAGDVTDPQVLNWALAKERDIEQKYGVTTGTDIKQVVYCISIADVIMQLTGGPLPATKEGINFILSQLPYELWANFITPDHTKLNVLMITQSSESKYLKPLGKALRDTDLANPPPYIDSVIVTSVDIDVQIRLRAGLEQDHYRITYIGIGLIFVALLILMKFRVRRVLTCLVPIVLILGWSSGIQYLLGIKTTLFMTTMPSQIVAIGTEFTILILWRYYEERDKGGGPDEAMAIAMSKIGRAILVSGLVVIGGFAAMISAVNLPILSNFGIMTCIDVFLCLVSSLLVLPAIVIWFDSRFRRDKETATAM